MYTIYCHLFPNGKRYVGITKTTLNRRWGNGNKYKTCRLVDRAIQKYGWDNIEHIVLDTAESVEEAESKEREYISKFRSDEVEYGYNLLPGGDVSKNELTDEMRFSLGNGWRGKHRTDIEKEKISAGVKRRFERETSNGHIGMKASDETKKKMSVSHKSRWAQDEERRRAASERMKKRMSDGEYREKVLDTLSKLPKRKSGEWSMPESAREKLSQANKGKWLGEKSPNSKPVLQYTKDGVFVKRWANAGEVERAGIAQRANVSKCCHGAPHVKTVGGYIWKFEE